MDKNREKSGYRRTIWRCNNKYEGERKCSTPHVTQEELEKVFVSVMQKVIAEKNAIFTDCREVLDEVLDTNELDRIATRVREQMMLISAVHAGWSKRMPGCGGIRRSTSGNTMRWQRSMRS